MPMSQGPTGELTVVDLCDYIGNKYQRNDNKQLYFDVTKFRPTLELPDPLCYNMLMQEIQLEASKCGSAVKGNGWKKSTNGPLKRKLVCFCRNCVYDPCKRSLIYEDGICCQKEYRKDSFVNSEKHGRQEQGKTKC